MEIESADPPEKSLEIAFERDLTERRYFHNIKEELEELRSLIADYEFCKNCYAVRDLKKCALRH